MLLCNAKARCIQIRRLRHNVLIYRVIVGCRSDVVQPKTDRNVFYFQKGNYAIGLYWTKESLFRNAHTSVMARLERATRSGCGSDRSTPSFRRVVAVASLRSSRERALSRWTLSRRCRSPHAPRQRLGIQRAVLTTGFRGLSIQRAVRIITQIAPTSNALF